MTAQKHLDLWERFAAAALAGAAACSDIAHERVAPTAAHYADDMIHEWKARWDRDSEPAEASEADDAFH